MQQVVSSRASKPLLFVLIDSGRSITEVGAATKSDFDKNKLRTMSHYQINFADACPVVPRDQT
jgi:hypothetical protein